VKVIRRRVIILFPPLKKNVFADTNLTLNLLAPTTVGARINP